MERGELRQRDRMNPQRGPFYFGTVNRAVPAPVQQQEQEQQVGSAPKVLPQAQRDIADWKERADKEQPALAGTKKDWLRDF